MSREINNEVKFGFLPAKKSEREFGIWDFLFIQVGFGIAAWCFLVGGYTGFVLDAKSSIATILFGNAFPVFLIMPIAIYFARYGVDTFIGFRTALGYFGSDAFFMLFAILNLGWISISSFMIGESAIKVARVFNMGEFWTSRSTGAPFFALIFFAIAFYVAYKGPVAIKWFNRIGVPAILLVLTALIFVVIFIEGFDTLFKIQPSEPYETTARTFATALEWNVGLGFSWLPYIGQWARLAKSEKVAYNGGFFGFGILLNVAAVFGAFIALLVISTDPTDWMIAIGGSSWGLIGLFLLILANTTSCVILIYSQAISFKTLFPDKKWIFAVGTTIPAALLMLSPTFYDMYGAFLAVIAYIMAALGGIIIVDYFVIKKQKVSVKDLYNRQGKYKYWRGFNPAALLSIVVATIFYWTLYNPITDVASPAFSYVSAGIPTFFVAAVAHYIGAKYIFKLDQYSNEQTEVANLTKEM